MARIPITENAVGALLPVSTINIGQMNVTRIAIAHRLSTILQVNQIIVLQKGKSPEIGTWEDRLKAGGYFSKINGLN
jgi:ABC-type transport system involved in Fe-S cluster assembly fused permease/ATPase subunit